MARLVFHRGQQPLLDHKLAPGRTLIGRSDSCDLVVPERSLSRTHCLVDLRDGAWWVTDRSRHGTYVNGLRVNQKQVLKEGDAIELGPFRLVFTAKDRPVPVTHALPPSLIAPVQLLEAREQLAVQRAVLEVTDGPAEGMRYPLDRLSNVVGCVGTKGIGIPDPSLAQSHFAVRLARGRPMLQPGAGGLFLDGERVEALTPVYPGEEVTAGRTRFVISNEVVNTQPESRTFGEMVGESEASRRLFGILRKMAASNAPVLILGESGTGKELAARGLHDHSARGEGPFIAVNCSAITEGLFESELFGHEKGAFTGASARRDGAFHAANNGTLFLDEVGELPEAAQAKLLRALESGEIRRVGSHKVEYPNVRLVAATNRDLETEVAEGRFRQDLFFRLAVLAVKLPPLRERPEDLAAIARTLARRIARDARLGDDAIAALQQHEFPGNVRELRNVLTRAYVLGGAQISASTLQFNPWSFEGGRIDPSLGEAQEHRQLADALARLDGNRSAVARELGIARSTLIYKLRKHGLG